MDTKLIAIVALAFSMGCAPSSRHIEQYGQQRNAQKLISLLEYRGVPPLTSEREVRRVRHEAALALGQLGDPCMVQPILDVARHTDQLYFLRGGREPGDALARAGAPTVDPLIDALQDRDWRVRCIAVFAMGKIGDKRAVEPLISTLKNDTNLEVREAALLALGELRMEDPVIAALEDKSGRIRRNAAKILRVKNMVDHAVQPLIVALGDEGKHIRLEAAWALGEVSDKHAVAEAIQQWVLRKGHISFGTGEAVAIALGELGDSEAVPLLIWLMEKGAAVKVETPSVSSYRTVRAATEFELRGSPYEPGSMEVEETHYVQTTDVTYPLRDSAYRALRSITKLDFGEDHLRWKQWFEGTDWDRIERMFSGLNVSPP